MIGGSNRMISIKELADFLGIGRSTVYKHWREYGIPHTQVGRLVRFRERDVALWVEAREKETRRNEKGRAPIHHGG